MCGEDGKRFKTRCVRVLSSCVVTLYGNTIHVGLHESVECGHDCIRLKEFAVFSVECMMGLCVADMMGCLPKA